MVLSVSSRKGGPLYAIGDCTFLRKVILVEIKFSQGFLSRVVMIRVFPGWDIIEGIEKACEELKITAGAITTCIGSLQRTAFFTVVPLENKVGAGYSTPITLEGPLELLSAQGTIGQDEKGNRFVHLHGAVSDRGGHAHGGHFIKGETPVLITCEIVINLIDEAKWLRIHDPELGMDVVSPSR
jgi:predicted DNA-binding protein with PD1-like motif